MKRSPSRLLPRLLLGSLMLLMGGTGTVGTLWTMGKIDLSFGRGVEPPAAPQGPPPGSVAVPISARMIPAFTKLTRDHFWDPKAERLTFLYLPKDAIRDHMILDLTKLFGRVLDHDKPSGYAFTEDDFLPMGTRPGVAAGVPAEQYRGMVFDAEKIKGVHGLRAGDHIDLMAGLPEDARITRRDQSRLLPGLQPAPGGGKKAIVQILAHDAIIVTPVTNRQLPPPNPRAPGKTVQEVLIAVHVDDITNITQALALDAEISCAVRTNRPQRDQVTQIPPQEKPKVIVIETISGNKRETLVFPDTTSSNGSTSPPR